MGRGGSQASLDSSLKGMQVGGISISLDAMGEEGHSNREANIGAQSIERRYGQFFPKDALIPTMHI